MGVIIRHINECFGQGPSKAKHQKEFFLMDSRKQKALTSSLVGLSSALSDYVHHILAGMIIVS